MSTDPSNDPTWDDPTWEQARDLFLDLAELPADECAAELELLESRDAKLAAWVRDLLQHDLGDDDSAGHTSPKRLGPYEVIRPIGQGGMGEVFLARRADGEYEQDVAVKLLRGGIASQDLIRRFLRERQTLAQLDHEFIASLLDGGTTDRGEPYLVMEFVDGERADKYAARLDLKERLQLFIRIGQAVAHAHEKGFVHRDLKPANILIRPDGMPRLLDFGIARLAADTNADGAGDGPLTRTGHRLFTPEYASPEQIRAETATEKSDIFALGVLLYKFLCDSLPWRTAANQHELELSICEEEPAPPSRRLTGTARGRVSGDLDAVVLQCLYKRPEQRYSSVDELCLDIERHLDGLPIKARRTSSWGRAVRFARRKPAYAIAGIFLVTAIAAGALAWKTQQTGEKQQAELREAISDRIDSAQLRWEDGQAEKAWEELELARTALSDLPDSDPLAIRILVQKTIFSNKLAEWDQALQLVNQARALLLKQGGNHDPQVVATLLNTRAYAMIRRHPGEASRKAAEEAHRYATSRLDPGNVLRIDAALGLSDELVLAGRPDEALETINRAIDELKQHDPKSEDLSRILSDRGVVQNRMGRFEDAADSYQEALKALAWHRGERHPNFAKVRVNLASSMFRTHRFEETREVLEEALGSLREHELEPFISTAQHFLGRIYSLDGKLEKAEACAREALEIRERLQLGQYIDRSLVLLGIVLAQRGQNAEAATYMSALLDHPDLTPGYLLPEMEAEARRRYGLILHQSGKIEKAQVHLAHAIELERELGTVHYATAEDLAALLTQE